MPQAMAASMTRKQSAAASTPSGLPPTRVSESAPSAVRVLPPSEREYRPTANRAGRPAPAMRPNTRIFQSAVRLIQDISLLPSRSGGRGLGRGFGRRYRSGPFGVHVAGVHLAAAGPPVDGRRDRREDYHVDDHAGGAADAVRQRERARPDQARRRQREYP